MRAFAEFYWCSNVFKKILFYKKRRNFLVIKTIFFVLILPKNQASVVVKCVTVTTAS